MKKVKVSMNIPVCLELLMLGLCKTEMRKFGTITSKKNMMIKVLAFH